MDALQELFLVVGTPSEDDGVLFQGDFVAAEIGGARAANWSESDKAGQHQPHQGLSHSYA